MSDPQIIRFELHASRGIYAVDVRLNNAHPAVAALVTPNAINALGDALCAAHGTSTRDAADDRRLFGLPVMGHHPLVGTWSIESPVGKEDTIPPVAWYFDERLRISTANPNEYPLLQGDLGPPAKNLVAFKKTARRYVEKALGEGAVLDVVSDGFLHQSALDAIFDNMDSGGGCGTC